MSTLGAWLKTQGFDVDDNNVPLGRTAVWRGVTHLMVHHTVSPCEGREEVIAEFCRKGAGGSADIAPLCQIVLGHSGKVWMACRERAGQPDPGRASHAGVGRGHGVPDNRMNEVCLGIEVQCQGNHNLATHATQYSALIDLLAALSRRYKVPVKNIIGHKEWSTTGKVDPRDDMDTIRADVAKEMGGAVSSTDGYLSLKETTPRLVRTNHDNLIDIKGVTRWVAEVAGRSTLAMYLNLNLPPSGSEARKAINRGGVRVWYRQQDLTADDDSDPTGYFGPLTPPIFGDQYFLLAHSWPHTVGKDFWEFCFRVYAFDANGKAVDIELELRTREIKIISDKT